MLPETFLTRLVSGSKVARSPRRLATGVSSAPSTGAKRWSALGGAIKLLVPSLMIFSPWLLAWLLATWRVNTLAPPAPLLRSTLLLPRADPPRLLEIDFSLPRVSDSIDSAAAAAAAAACVV